MSINQLTYFQLYWIVGLTTASMAWAAESVVSPVVPPGCIALAAMMWSAGRSPSERGSIFLLDRVRGGKSTCVPIHRGQGEAAGRSDGRHDRRGGPRHGHRGAGNDPIQLGLRDGESRTQRTIFPPQYRYTYMFYYNDCRSYTLVPVQLSLIHI